MDMGNQDTVVGSVDTTADSIAAAAAVVVVALQKSLLPDKVRSNRKQNRINHLPTQNGHRQVMQLETTSIHKTNLLGGVIGWWSLGRVLAFTDGG